MINKRLTKILIAALIILIIFVVIIYIRAFSKKERQPVPAITPRLTQIPTQVPKYEAYSITSLVPSDGAINIPLDQPLIVTFNKSVKDEPLILAIDPKFEYQTEVSGSSITFIPNTQLSPGTRYTYALLLTNYPDLLRRTYTFTTIGPTTAFLPETQSEEGIKAEEEYNRLNFPDIYLKYKTPLSSATFSVKSNLRSLPKEHYYFIVTLIGFDKEKEKNDFLSWVKDQGLTQQQIDSLDFDFR